MSACARDELTRRGLTAGLFFYRGQIQRYAKSELVHSITDRISGSGTSFYPRFYSILPIRHRIRKKNELSDARTFSSSWNLRDGTKANYAPRRVRGLSGSHKEFLPMRHPLYATPPRATSSRQTVHLIPALFGEFLKPSDYVRPER